MSLAIRHNDEVRPVQSGSNEENLWQAVGSDPAFRISYPLLRKRRFLLIEVAAIGEPIDPIIYLNFGQGFTEERAFTFGVGKRFIFFADLGSFGTIRSLRVDPATWCATFVFRVEDFLTKEDLSSRIENLARIGYSAQICDLGTLPRFWLSVPLGSLARRRQNALKNYVQSLYKLASSVSPAPGAGRFSPWISIVVPVYNTPSSYLDDLLSSFQNQRQSGAELILSDDGSTSPETIDWLRAVKGRAMDNVTVLFGAKNGGISAATNTGLRSAGGEWVAFLDHDDAIAPHALKLIKYAIDTNPHLCFLYTDELIVDRNLRPKGVMLKPAYDPVLLSGVNYINHFSVYRRRRLEEVGPLRSAFDGSQDYDFLLRYLRGIPEENILHLPYAAYWWRQTGESYSSKYLTRATAAARQALEEHFSSDNQVVRVEPALSSDLHRVCFDKPDTDMPFVSIIIPNKNCFAMIDRVLRDIFKNTNYPKFEVIVVDNGTDEESVLSLYDDYRGKFDNFNAIVEVDEFNFSRLVNKGFRAANGEHFLLLNNDVEVIEPNWLREMVSCLSYDHVGIVGAKLLYPNNTLQHAGVIVGFGAYAGHWFQGKPADFGGPLNRLKVRNTLTCVTGAVMLISGSCMRSVGDWDEANFAVAYNDVDYCMRARERGFRVVWTPFACLYHHESVSRGSDENGPNKRRFDREKRCLQAKYRTSEFEDSATNPHYSKNVPDPVIVVRETLFDARPSVRKSIAT